MRWYKQLIFYVVGFLIMFFIIYPIKLFAMGLDLVKEIGYVFRISREKIKSKNKL